MKHIEHPSVATIKHRREEWERRERFRGRWRGLLSSLGTQFFKLTVETDSWWMSLVRIVAGVAFVAGVLLGLKAGAEHWPKAARVGYSLFVLGGVGVLFIWKAIRDARRRETNGKFTTYKVSEAPCHFLFFITFYFLLGVIFLAIGLGTATGVWDLLGTPR